MTEKFQDMGIYTIKEIVLNILFVNQWFLTKVYKQLNTCTLSTIIREGVEWLIMESVTTLKVALSERESEEGNKEVHMVKGSVLLEPDGSPVLLGICGICYGTGTVGEDCWNCTGSSTKSKYELKTPHLEKMKIRYESQKQVPEKTR
jgi:hypothetical protein